MNIVGTKDGRPFHHTIRFDVAGMTKPERDSLYQQTVRSLNTLDIKNVPGAGLEKPDTVIASRSVPVVFICESCTGKGELEIRGNNFLSTRSFNPKRKPELRFPLTMRLSPGEYRYKYWQKGVQQMELPFTVKAGEKNIVTVK